MKNKKIGVIVDYFQKSFISQQDNYFISKVLQEVDELVILVRKRIVRSAFNPMPISVVELMLQEFIETKKKKIFIGTIDDCKQEDIFNKEVQDRVNKLNSTGVTTLYKRDEFILPASPNVVYLPADHEILSFNAGYQKAVEDEFPAHYAVVDAIITDGSNVLLGHKKSGWCLIGGFADTKNYVIM